MLLEGLELLRRWVSYNISTMGITCDLQLSSPSKMPGMPTRSMGMPSSASASMFSGCCLANREEKAAEV